MIVELELCGPKGAGQIELWSKLLETVQRDNEMLIEAMLRAGMQVPDTVEDLGIPYVPPTVFEARNDRQRLSGLGAMLDRRSFSCGDAAPLEAAVLVRKHGVPARAVPAMLPTKDPSGASVLLHSVYVTPYGTIDPIQRWLAANGRAGEPWEATR